MSTGQVTSEVASPALLVAPRSKFYSGITYEQVLDTNKEWAMDEGGLFFEGKSRAHKALAKITKKLDALGVDYAVAGGMALYHHGHRRFTEDVDILVTAESLEVIHRELEGLGYLPPFSGSRHLRDTEFGVKVEFLVTGDFPGDGKPKAISFPDPGQVSEEFKGVKYLNLATFVSLKLASGMTNVNRGKDLFDAEQLMGILVLPRDFADQLHPFVREKYREIWDRTHAPTDVRYIFLWEVPPSVKRVGSIDDLIPANDEQKNLLARMKQDGVHVATDVGIQNGKVMLVTTDPVIASRHEMSPESQLMKPKTP